MHVYTDTHVITNTSYHHPLIKACNFICCQFFFLNYTMKYIPKTYIVVISVLLVIHCKALPVRLPTTGCITLTRPLEVISVDGHSSTIDKESVCSQQKELLVKFTHNIDSLNMKLTWVYNSMNTEGIMKSSTRNSCNYVSGGAMEDSCKSSPVAVIVSNDVLKLAIHTDEHNMDRSIYYCISDITATTCQLQHTVYKRHTKEDQYNYGDSGPVSSILLSVGILVMVCVLVMASLFGCCVSHKKKTINNNNNRSSSISKSVANGSNTDNVVINNYTYSSSKGSNETISIVASGSIPGSPEAIALDPPQSPVYVDPATTRPTSLNIPVNKDSVNRHDRIRSNSSGVVPTSSSKDHTYSVLEVTSSSLPPSSSPVPPPVSVLSTSATRSINSTLDASTPPTPKGGRHSYFILDVNTHEEDVPVITPDTPTPSDISPYSVLPFGGSNNRIYHVVEPLSSDSDKYCSVCHSLIKDEPDSLYLVILPDDTKISSNDTTTSEQDTPTIEATPTSAVNEPVYQVLEEVNNGSAAVVCQSCLYANESDPIYSEVDRLPDHVYDHVKLFRQDTTLSDHIYMSLEVQDSQTPPNSRKRYLKEIRMKPSVDDSDITSPGTPTGPLQVIGLGGRKLSQQGQLFQIIESLSRRVDPRGKAIGGNEHSSPSKSLSRSMSYCTYTPPMVIEALHKRDGTYHKLNVDSLWEFQQEHRYAPVSIILRNKGRRGMRGKRIKSLMTRGSMVDEDMSPLENIRRASDYEVPIDTHPHMEQPSLAEEPVSKAPVTINEAGSTSTKPFDGPIPPPPLINRTSQVMFRQQAIELDHIDETPPSRKISVMSSSMSTSEPCISSFDDENDYDRLSPIKAHPSSPTSRYTMGRRAMTEPILRPFLLYGKKDSDDYEIIEQSPH